MHVIAWLRAKFVWAEKAVPLKRSLTDMPRGTLSVLGAPWVPLSSSTPEEGRHELEVEMDHAATVRGSTCRVRRSRARIRACSSRTGTGLVIE
jgi:hypothetical protein